MTLQLFAHPFSSYCQKVLMALYENGTPFRLRMLGPENPDNEQEWAKYWPFKKMPLLLDGAEVVAEATIIIEHLHVYHAGPVRFIPDDADEALEVRFMDRFFDNYIATPQQKVVFDSIRPEDQRDPAGVADAKAQLEQSYAWLDERMAGREWAAGAGFSLADCSAAPQLFYADWTVEIGGQFANVRAYRERLLNRKSFKRCVDDARPFRPFFPPGAPERD